MAAASTLAHRYAREPFGSESNSSWSPSPPPKAKVAFSNASRQRKTLRITACRATDERVIKDDEVAPTGEFEKHEGHPPRAGVSSRAAQRSARKEVERTTYLVAAIMSSLGISSLAVVSIYYRFSWQMEGGDVPILEMFGTFALSVGAAVGMEYWARWAHRALWHDSLWHMHESHHRPRDGPYELNDAFAIINAVPAIGLMAYGYFNKGLIPGLCFGAGLGITVFGMAYMFVHDGLVHRRFPVGPIANVPYLRRVAAAHQLHHSDKFDGVPYGLFLGPEVTVALLFSTIIMSNTWSGNVRPVIDRTGYIWGAMIWLSVMVSGARRSGRWLGRIAEGDPAKDEGLRANGPLIKRDNPKSLSSYT